MEALFKMLTPAHSDQSFGIRSKDCSGPRKEGGSVVKKQKHAHGSLRGAGMQGDEGVRGVSLYSPFYVLPGSSVPHNAGHLVGCIC